MTQKEAVLKYIKEEGSITSWQAIMELGVTRLADVIYRLKNDGYGFNIVNKAVATRYGRKTVVAEYSLQEIVSLRVAQYKEKL